VADFLTLEIDADASSPLERLTSRKCEVLQLISEGYTNNAIALVLQVSVKTVEKHRANLMSKVNVHDLAGLIRMVIKHDPIFLEE
jgi:DNA-binding NarL/FixJ family response regulator